MTSISAAYREAIDADARANEAVQPKVTACSKYMIQRLWFHKFLSYIDESPSNGKVKTHPGQIQNSQLLSDTNDVISSSSSTNFDAHVDEDSKIDEFTRHTRRQNWQEKERCLKSFKCHSELLGGNAITTSAATFPPLRPDLRINDDYVLVGENTWKFISTQFSYDVELFLPYTRTESEEEKDSLEEVVYSSKSLPEMSHYNHANNANNKNAVLLQSSERWHLNNDLKDDTSLQLHHATMSGMVSEGEGSSLSESGDDLFPSLHQESQCTTAASCLTHSPQMPVLSEHMQIVPFDHSKSSIGISYADRECKVDTDGSDEDAVPVFHEEQEDNIPITTKRKRATGLGNLGNTCFMNSTLQCLAHTATLREYFLSGEFRKDINKDNPLGTGGELAIEFSNLMRQMWCIKKEERVPHPLSEEMYSSSSRLYTSGNNDNEVSTVTYPRSFKYTLGKYAEQFMGYDQHDSQELAIYLLDALHEDTNRVTKKPYIEKPEQEENESDDIAANKAWNVHLQRENSRVFENFMGQIKSRLQCTTKGCGRVSTTFDPSMYLSVPIPGSMDREMKVTFVPLNRSQTCAVITVKLCKNSSIAGLRKHVADLAKECYGFKEEDLHEEDIQLVDIFHDKVYAYYKEEHPIDKIKDSDVSFAYQLTPLSTIKKQFSDYQEKQKSSDSRNDSDDKCANSFLLDPVKRQKLDMDDHWQKELERFVPHPKLTLSRLFNEKRSSTQDKREFYEKLTRFLERCRKCPDCKQPDTTMDESSNDVIMEEKSDKTESSFLPNRRRVNYPPDEFCSLSEICEMSTSFRNIRSVHDVAVLEYCAFKYKAFMNNVELDSKTNGLCENGFTIQIAFKKPHADKSGYNWKRTGKSIVVRVPSTLTVYELRNVLSHHISDILRVDDYHNEHNASNSSFADMRPHTAIIKQVALSYETSTKYSHNNNDEAFGSVREKHLIEGTPVVAKPSDNEEMEPIAKFISDQDSTIFLSLPPRLCDVINEDVINISDVFLSKQQKNEKAKQQNNKVSVMDCIAKFCQSEQLEENDMWYCNRCKQHNQAWKECHLYRMPPILIIHLKRFHFSSRTHRRDKIDTLIDFPLNDLDLREFVTYWEHGQEPIYQCYAVSNHFGGLGGGHYTAYARGDDNLWSNFDDSRVTSGIDESEVVSSAAYCLYYRRNDVAFNNVKEIDELAHIMGLDQVQAIPCHDSPVEMNVDDHVIS